MSPSESLTDQTTTGPADLKTTELQTSAQNMTIGKNIDAYYVIFEYNWTRFVTNKEEELYFYYLILFPLNDQ